MLGPEEKVFLALDAAAILATAIMLYLTERKMDDAKTKARENRIHEMLSEHRSGADYDVSTWTVDDIIADLLAYGEFGEMGEDWTEDDIRPHVITWKMKHGALT